MDTVESGKGAKAALLVLTERKTRYEMIFKIRSKTQSEVIRILNILERKLGAKGFRSRFKSITCDNGSEFLDWSALEKSLLNNLKHRTSVCFCHPYCAYERGSNENANKLIRRSIPKGANIADYTHKKINAIQDYINNYPRKLLEGYPSNSFYPF